MIVELLQSILESKDVISFDNRLGKQICTGLIAQALVEVFSFGSLYFLSA